MKKQLFKQTSILFVFTLLLTFNSCDLTSSISNDASLETSGENTSHGQDEQEPSSENLTIKTSGLTENKYIKGKVSGKNAYITLYARSAKFYADLETSSCDVDSSCEGRFVYNQTIKMLYLYFKDDYCLIAPVDLSGVNGFAPASSVEVSFLVLSLTEFKAAVKAVEEQSSKTSDGEGSSGTDTSGGGDSGGVETDLDDNGTVGSDSTNTNRIDVKGQLTVYVGSTARPLYAITAPSYADFDYITIGVKSLNKQGVEAYFTCSCAEDDDGWSEFVIEGIKKGTYKVVLSVEEFNLSKVFEVKVVDKDSLSITDTDLKLERNDTHKLSVNNEMNIPLNFSSTNEEVATVSSDGTVKALKSGRAQIIVESEDGILTSSCNVTVKSGVVADKYFWGGWISMFDGSHLKIQEKDVTYWYYDENDKEVKYELEIDSTSNNEIDIIEKDGTNIDKTENFVIGKFTKSTGNVMIYDYDSTQENGKNIPFFRNGGQNLKYTLQLVGFTKEEANSSRAVSTLNLSGLKVKGQSNTYTSYETDEQTSNAEGKVTLTAPVAGDVQTVTVTGNDGAVIVVPALKIETNGVAMGKIPVVNKGDYSLKVTGTPVGEQIDEDDGYLYQGEDKSYEMEICITNISEVKSGAGHISITSADPALLVVSPVSLDNFEFNTLKPGASKKIKVNICYTGKSSMPYVDTALNISITQAKTSVSPERTWNDIVPVRFFQKKVPIYIRPQLLDAYEGDDEAHLNIFVMYPDGSCSYNSLEDREPGCLEVPSFGSEKPYYLALCGASADSVCGSSEMWYSVNLEGVYLDHYDLDSIHVKLAINTSGDIGFGESNDAEDFAYELTDTSFQAAITDGDIDFWKFYIK